MIDSGLIFGIAGTVLALVFGLISRCDRRRGSKSEAKLEYVWNEIEKHKARERLHGQSMDSDSEFRSTLERLRDSHN